MNNEYWEALDELKVNVPAKTMIFRSLKSLIPYKGNCFGLFVSALFAALFAFIIGNSEDAITLLLASASVLLNAQLAIFAVILTVYSIIFVFFDDKKLIIFAKIKGKDKKSFLNITITFYQSVMFLYFVNIAITGILVLLMGVIPSDFRLTQNLNFDRWLATGLLFLYFCFSFRVFYEVKSVIYNTIQLFRLGVLLRLKKYSEEDSKSIQSDE